MVTVQGSRLGKRLKLDPEMLVENPCFATSLPSTMLLVCGDVEAGDFLVQNAYKMPHGGEKQPLNH
jgi:hypothetical protein